MTWYHELRGQPTSGFSETFGQKRRLCGQKKGILNLNRQQKRYRVDSAKIGYPQKFRSLFSTLPSRPSFLVKKLWSVHLFGHSPYPFFFQLAEGLWVIPFSGHSSFPGFTAVSERRFEVRIEYTQF